MEQAEFQALLDNESTHWWYRGRLRIVLEEIRRLAPAPGARFLDAGCGSGLVMAQLARLGEVAGVDIHPAALAASRARRAGQVLEAPVERMPFSDAAFDLVTCLDVIEHTPDDVATFRELLRVTRPGGHLVVTVPAYQALWSSHDEANGHHRRYVRGPLRAAAERAGWRLERDTYFNSLLLPPAAAVRLARRMRGAGRRGSDLALTPPALNPLLELPLRLEAALIRSGGRLPAGLSLAATFCRPEPVLAAVTPLYGARHNAPAATG